MEVIRDLVRLANPQAIAQPASLQRLACLRSERAKPARGAEQYTGLEADDLLVERRIHETGFYRVDERARIQRLLVGPAGDLGNRMRDDLAVLPPQLAHHANG